ncbi:MAG TPA: GNAT family N-acetyltransferase [Candidatus Angelobacter sp.]|nr:GNAT family N-acetyltransferase [Candidatus Angelobacter sp.]
MPLREHYLTTSDYEMWQKYLPASQSVFGSVGYARICERYRESSPRLYVVASENASICYPLLLRSTNRLPFTASTSTMWDSTTPDFTGPLLAGTDDRVVEAFSRRLEALFQSERIVAEFAHLNPWSNARMLLDPQGLVYNRDIVWVDLSLSLEELWDKQLRPSNRNKIRIAARSGVRVFASSAEDHLREFCRIYEGTMRRNHAQDAYYFPFNFFRSLRDELPNNARFVFAEYEDKIVSAMLYLHDHTHIFQFLGGTDASFHSVKPTNAVIWDTIQWARQAGKKRMILGGGYRPDDGIFQFKASFSRLRQPFHIYRRVHLHQDYALLERQCRDYYSVADLPADYFPSYRHTPKAKHLVAGAP